MYSYLVVDVDVDVKCGWMSGVAHDDTQHDATAICGATILPMTLQRPPPDRRAHSTAGVGDWAGEDAMMYAVVRFVDVLRIS